MNNKSITQQLANKKILFASIPADGHFNPLTGLAKHLQEQGCDVRWYTSSQYASKLEKLDVPHYPFVKALDIPGDQVDEYFPERKHIKNKIKKLNFDLVNYFILRSTEFYEDIQKIHHSFPFDLMIADCAFMGIPFVKEKMNIPVIAAGIVPLYETSKDLAPNGLAMTPARNFMEKTFHGFLRLINDKVLFRQADKVFRKILDDYNITHKGIGIFDVMIRKSDYLLQSGTPGFEYYRSDIGKNIRFIGSLLPYNANQHKDTWFDVRVNQYKNIALVTQGTVEKDIDKIIVPTLEAFKDSDTLVIVTTGGSKTQELRARYPQNNFIIEDFIPFADVMPFADVYISNGGYGGVLLGIENRLPMVVAGVHEGKNEICARIGYFNYGINLKTEKPTPEQIFTAVNDVLRDNRYKVNIMRLSREFEQYNPNELCARYAAELIGNTKTIQRKKDEPVSI